MKRNPATHGLAPLAGLTVSETRTHARPWRAFARALAMIVLSFLTGCLCCYLVHRHGPVTQVSGFSSQLSTAEATP